VDAQQDQEQRRAVDAAVVRGLGDLVEVGQLVDAQLVEDLAGLLVAPVVDLAALVQGEHAQGVGGDLRLEGGHLHRGHQAVAPEQRHVPGDAGSEEELVLLAHRQHVQIQE
jgi:hypothetical protein